MRRKEKRVEGEEDTYNLPSLMRNQAFFILVEKIFLNDGNDSLFENNELYL